MLIDSEELLNSLKNNKLIEMTPALEKAINNQPIAYDLNKVIKKLKEFDNVCITCRRNDECDFCTIEKRISIVRKGGK